MYPTRPALRSLLWEALPEIEPDRRLLAAVRQSIDKEMERPAWSFFQLMPSLSFAGGVAALFAVLCLPALWMGSSPRLQSHSIPVVAKVERIEVQSGLASPFNNANPLVVVDPLTSLQGSHRSQIQPGSVVHVIYPFKSRKTQPQQKAVVHY